MDSPLGAQMSEQVCSCPLPIRDGHAHEHGNGSTVVDGYVRACVAAGNVASHWQSYEVCSSPCQLDMTTGRACEIS